MASSKHKAANVNRKPRHHSGPEERDRSPEYPAPENLRSAPRIYFVVLMLALAGAAFIRFYDLGRSEVRGDELNFLNWSLRNPAILELWKNPPWLDQIPLSESIAVLWARIRPGVPDEGSVREPFAFLGWLTIAFGAWWMARRWSASAAFLFAAWMAFLPFHVFQSREAYYYVVAMFFSLGLGAATADRMTRLMGGTPLKPADFGVWFAWALPACLSHMAVWVYTAVCWLALLVAGWRGQSLDERKRHAAWMLGTGFLLLILMSRWIFRAIRKVLEAKSAAGVLTDTGFIGGALAWVAPRVLPMFVGGVNLIGFALLIVLILSAAFVLGKWREQDRSYWAISILAVGGMLASYAYVTFVGRGSAKISYFSPVLPIFLLWAGLSVDLASRRLNGLVSKYGPMLLGLLILALLAWPAWMVTRLTGKPVPYRALQHKLDELLPPGSVAIIDRWFEPWNEMARYAPSNVTVTFTVPDEPFDNYMRLRWRDVTRARIEAGGIDAFIRLARNHEERIGLWTWPETWFKRRAEVRNEAAFWLRDHGYAPEEDYHGLNDKRMRIEIFYNTRDDAVAQEIAAGRAYPVFFHPDLPFEKSGPMGFFRFKTPQFMDWRVLFSNGTFEVINPRSESGRVQIEISAVSPVGNKLVTALADSRFLFTQGQAMKWVLGPIELLPGTNQFVLRDQHASATVPLLISSIVVRDAAKAP